MVWFHLHRRDKFLENSTFVLHSLELSYLGFKLQFRKLHFQPLFYRCKGF